MNNLNKKNKILLSILCLLLAVVIVAGVGSLFKKPTSHSAEPENVYGVAVYNDFISETLPCRPGTLRKIKYVVIHETANAAKGSNAKNHSEFLKRGGEGKVSWHYTVDDTEIYHHIPDNEEAWHAGEREGNAHGIGVELCVNSDGDFEKTFENGAKLTAYLIEAYNLSIDDVRQHNHFSGKNCPMKIRESDRWDEFLQRVEYYLEIEKNDE